MIQEVFVPRDDNKDEIHIFGKWKGTKKTVEYIFGFTEDI